jgi:hypothetical protein
MYIKGKFPYQKYIAMLRLHQKLCKQIIEVRGHMVPLLTEVSVIPSELALKYWTDILEMECKSMIIQIEISKELALCNSSKRKSLRNT